MNNTYKVLSDFGLAENEIKIYLEAIKHREISPFKLARLTGIARTTVYDVMTGLALKGLITIRTNQGLEKQQTWISAKNPSALRDMIFKRREDLMELEVGIVDILPDLKKEFLPHEQNGSMRFYPGRDGVKRMYAFIESLPVATPIYLFDHLMPMDTLGRKYINKEVAQSLDSRAGRMGRRVKTIIPLNDWTMHVLSYQYGRDKRYIKHHNFRYIDHPFFRLHQDIYILPDRVVIICAKDDELWGATVESKLFSSSLRSMFEILWVIAQPVNAEFMAELGENEFLKEEKRRQRSK